MYICVCVCMCAYLVIANVHFGQFDEFFICAGISDSSLASCCLCLVCATSHIAIWPVSFGKHVQLVFFYVHLTTYPNITTSLGVKVSSLNDLSSLQSMLLSLSRFTGVVFLLQFSRCSYSIVLWNSATVFSMCCYSFLMKAATLHSVWLGLVMVSWHS